MRDRAMTMGRILVCRGEALRDLILTLPVFEGIRSRWPGAHLCHAGCFPQARLVQAAGLADSLFSLDSAQAAEWFAPCEDGIVRRNDWLGAFDMAITFLPDADGRFRKRLAQAGVRQVLYRSPHVVEGHASDYFAGVLEGVKADGGLRLRLPQSVLEAGRRRVCGMGEKVVAVHPGSGSPRKNWPLANFARLADLIRSEGAWQPVFLAGEAESRIFPELLALSPGTRVVTGLDVVELAGFLAGCAAFVGNDSGVTHLAAAMGIPVVGLFGPTDPATWAPRGPNVRSLERRDPTRGNPCIQVAEVAAALGNLLSRH